jgi:hypothetical protein
MLGGLELFGDVFDIEYYKNHIAEYLEHLPDTAAFFADNAEYERERDKLLNKYSG